MIWSVIPAELIFAEESGAESARDAVRRSRQRSLSRQDILSWQGRAGAPLSTDPRVHLYPCLRNRAARRDRNGGR